MPKLAAIENAMNRAGWMSTASSSLIVWSDGIRPSVTRQATQLTQSSVVFTKIRTRTSPHTLLPRISDLRLDR